MPSDLDTLRRRIAERLGYTNLREDDIYMSGEMFLIGDDTDGEGVAIPNWPTDDRDAVMLLEEATRRGLWCKLKVGFSCTEVEFMLGKKVVGKDTSNTFALAVSRAFDAAMEATTKGTT